MPNPARKGGAGLDFVWLDNEHTPMDFETVQAHVIACERVGAVPVLVAYAVGVGR